MKAWQYQQSSTHQRDERIDFIRGMVMIILIVVHIDIFSLYNFLAWERLGVVTGAEGFVLLSGVVLGMINRRRISQNGWKGASIHLFDRSFQLYRVSLFVIISIPIIHIISYIDASALMSFTSSATQKVYWLYPSWDVGFQKIFAKIVLLKYGPHQFQVLGLYIILLLFAPFALWLLIHKRFKLLLAMSWVIYIANAGYNWRLTGAQFEYAFPVLSWQVLFFNGLVLGYYKEEVWEFFHTMKGKVFFGFILMLFFAFLFFTYNNPMPQIPEWLRLSIIEPQAFREYYTLFFKKNILGYGRVINDFVVLIVFYGFLSYFWMPIKKILGWIILPIGQSSLYVFIWHIYFCILIANIPLFHENNIWINTLGHTLVFLAIWGLVKKRILFNIVPR